MAYIIITAPGCYGTHAHIHSRHESLAAARAAKGSNPRVIISTDGGWTDSHQPGDRIHQADAHHYRPIQ